MISANATQNPKIFCGAARRLTAAPRRAKKVTFQWGGGRSRDVDIFLRFFLVGGSFYVILMKVHARTGPVAVAGFEKMLAKVKDFLHEVSLYQRPDKQKALRAPRKSRCLSTPPCSFRSVF
jgi:hypothetical protein